MRRVLRRISFSATVCNVVIIIIAFVFISIHLHSLRGLTVIIFITFFTQSTLWQWFNVIKGWVLLFIFKFLNFIYDSFFMLFNIISPEFKFSEFNKIFIFLTYLWIITRVQLVIKHFQKILRLNNIFNFLNLYVEIGE